MVTVLVVLSIGVVVYIASDLFQEDSITRVQEMNKETAEHLGERVQAVFEDSFNRLTLMAQFATRSATKEEAVRAIQNTLAGSEDIVSFYAYQVAENGQLNNMYSIALDTVLAEFNITTEQLRDKPRNHIILEQLVDSDKISVVNSAPELGVSLFSMSFFSKDAKEIVAINSKATPAEKLRALKGKWFFRADVRHDPVLKLFTNKNFHVSYLVDRKGKLLAHSKPDMISGVIEGLDLSENPIVWKLTETQVDNHQMEYMGDDGEFYLGAFKKLKISGIGVIAEVQKRQALATINRVQYRSFLVMVIVVCLAFVMNFLFSQTLTSPIKRLFEATEQIVEGNYNVSLRASSTDEIGALSSAFVNMTEGLREREKLKGAFAKFHSKEIAKKLLSGEIKLGGEKKHCTVFFSDIRGFTKMSEDMTPDQVVAMLNEYMTEMVKIIYKWNGVVDKYVGDAIMAEWGVPNTNPDDAYNAVRAALEMREFMMGFNLQKEQHNQRQLKIGIGLHSGPVLAGNIGSEERLEYTVIGDTVNQAARIEAATKVMVSDLLISEDTYTLVKDRGIICGPTQFLRAKGKTENLKVYKVIGYQNESGELQTVLTAEEIAAINTQPTHVVAAEESKVEIAYETPQPVTEHPAVELPTDESPATGVEIPMPTRTEVDIGVRVPMSTKTQIQQTKTLHLVLPNEEQSDIQAAGSQANGSQAHDPGVSTPKDTDGNPPDIDTEDDGSQWFLIDHSAGNEPEGPYSLKEIILKARSLQIDPGKIHAFREGDPATTPVWKLPGMQRKKLPVVSVPIPSEEYQQDLKDDEWYVHGPRGTILGPVTTDQLFLTLDNGNITRTTLVWTKGYSSWIYLYEIPGFERRETTQVS